MSVWAGSHCGPPDCCRADYTPIRGTMVAGLSDNSSSPTPSCPGEPGLTQLCISNLESCPICTKWVSPVSRATTSHSRALQGSPPAGGGSVRPPPGTPSPALEAGWWPGPGFDPDLYAHIRIWMSRMQLSGQVPPSLWRLGTGPPGLMGSTRNVSHKTSGCSSEQGQQVTRAAGKMRHGTCLTRGHSCSWGQTCLHRNSPPAPGGNCPPSKCAKLRLKLSTAEGYRKLGCWRLPARKSASMWGWYSRISLYISSRTCMEKRQQGGC